MPLGPKDHPNTVTNATELPKWGLSTRQTHELRNHQWKAANGRPERAQRMVLPGGEAVGTRPPARLQPTPTILNPHPNAPWTPIAESFHQFGMPSRQRNLKPRQFLIGVCATLTHGEREVAFRSGRERHSPIDPRAAKRSHRRPARTRTADPNCGPGLWQLWQGDARRRGTAGVASPRRSIATQAHPLSRYPHQQCP